MRDLIAAGEIGEVVSATMVVSGSGAGARAGTLHWQIDKDMGATVLTIQGGHAIDSLRYALGEIAALSATVRTLFPDVVVQGTNEVLHPTAPDNVVVGPAVIHTPITTIVLQAGQRGTVDTYRNVVIDFN